MDSNDRAAGVAEKIAPFLPAGFAVFCVLFVMLLIIPSKRNLEQAPPRKIGPIDIAYYLISLILVAVSAFILVELSSILRMDDLGPLGILLIDLASGVVLFVLRSKRLDIYGVIEIFVAFAVMALIGTQKMSSNFMGSIVGFVGAVYVLIRGMANFIDFYKTKEDGSGIVTQKIEED